jgi:hypothetical protein
MPDTFTVKIHADGHATPEHQHGKNGDTVLFTSDQGSWTVTFDSGTPLPQASYSGNQGASAGGVLNGTVGTTYKYTSCCTKSGTTTCQDPDIIIDS